MRNIRVRVGSSQTYARMRSAGSAHSALRLILGLSEQMSRTGQVFAGPSTTKSPTPDCEVGRILNPRSVARRSRPPSPCPQRSGGASSTGPPSCQYDFAQWQDDIEIVQPPEATSCTYERGAASAGPIRLICSRAPSSFALDSACTHHVYCSPASGRQSMPVAVAGMPNIASAGGVSSKLEYPTTQPVCVVGARPEEPISLGRCQRFSTSSVVGSSSAPVGTVTSPGRVPSAMSPPATHKPAQRRKSIGAPSVP